MSGSPTAFQSNAFQNNAFQIGGGKKVGWPDTLRRRIPREKLEQLLKLQQDRTFGRKWFEEFESAQQEFAEAEAKAAVEVAAREAREAAELIHERARESEFKDALRQVALTLQLINEVRLAPEIIAGTEFAKAIAAAARQKIEMEDEEEAIALLLH